MAVSKNNCNLVRGFVTEAPFQKEEQLSQVPARTLHCKAELNQCINPAEACAAVLGHPKPFNLSAAKKSVITTQMIAQNKVE